MNLAYEYYVRHNLKCISPANNGLMFYKENKKPSLVVHTGIRPKVHITCQICEKIDTLAIELFAADRENGYSIVGHYHVHPDIDLNKWIHQIGIKNVEPVNIKHNKEIELWIWSFFFQQSRMRSNIKFRSWAKEQTSQEPLSTYERMIRCSTYFPDCFQSYCKTYNELTVGRKYLYFG